MKRRRSLIAVLLLFVLPYAAAASLVDGLRCGHVGSVPATAARLSDGAPMHHDHAAMLRAHHATPAGHDSCDCPLKCDCAHHCAGSGCNAALPLPPLTLAVADNAAPPLTRYAARVSDARHSPAFRPPIAALPSAA